MLPCPLPLSAMKCFHFPNVDADAGPGSNTGMGRRMSWATSPVSASGDSHRYELAGTQEVEPAQNWDFLSSRHRQGSGVGGLRPFGFAELRAATQGFSGALLIGEGGFGCVYRGVVDGSAGMMDVAVKQLNRNGLQGHKEWITEVTFLGIVNHPNLVKLIGYCAEDDERGIQRLLVYELLPNKSLEGHLHSRVHSPLPWALRLKIAQDGARGLAYLHEEMDFQVIFRDFKTSNILLDENFNAKLSDFGLARQGPSEGHGHVSTSVVGTIGYAAPEYVHSGRLTAKSDVWSFGVVLYELITGRRSVDRNLPRGEQKLLEWVKPYATVPKKFYMIIDNRLKGQYCQNSAQKVIALANKCLMKQPKSCPHMSEVVEMLGQIIDMANEKQEATEGGAPSVDNVLHHDPVERSQSVNGGVAHNQADNLKEGSSFRKRIIGVKDFISLRSRSVRRPDWQIG